MSLVTSRREGSRPGERARPTPTGRRGGSGTSRSGGRRFWVVVAAGAVLVSAWAAGVGTEALVRPGGFPSFLEFFAAAVHPRLDAGFLALTLRSALTTLAYAVLGTALSLLIGFVGGVLGAQAWWFSGRRRSTGRFGWVLSRAVLVLPRGIHEVVWGLFFLAVFGLDPLVAVLAIGIPFGAVTAKVFSELLDEVPRGRYTALLSCGASRGSAVLYGLLPPALPDLVSYSFYRFECAIRSAVILGLIGAGGLGFQLALSFQTLRYQEIWTLLYALILLCVAADYWSSVMRKRRGPGTSRPLRRVPPPAGSLVLGTVLIGLSSWWVGLDPGVLFDDRSWQIGGRILADAWPPALDEIALAELLRMTGVTVAMSILAIAVAFGGGSLLAFPASRMPRLAARAGDGGVRRLGRALARLVSRVVLVVLRAIPPPVWALLFLFVLYPGILPGAVALGVYTMGVLGRLMAEVAENLDERPLRALRTHGAGGAHVFCYGVMPAAAPRFVAYGLYRWEVTVRETVVVGVVGAGGLGLLLDHQLSSFHYDGALATLITLIVLTFVVDLTSAAIRRSLR